MITKPLNIVALIFVLLLLPSCGKKVKFENILVNNNCYWDIYDKKYSSLANTCWKFYADNRCEYFSYKFIEKGQRTSGVHHYNEDDDIRPDVWNVRGDTLMARKSEYKIIKYNSDTITLGSFSSADTIMLIKNCTTQLIK